MVKTLFNTLPAVVQMSAFTIVKFVLKTISTHSRQLMSREISEESFVFPKRCRFDKKIRGRNTVHIRRTEYFKCDGRNSASAFDCAVHQRFSQSGMIYYERYIDDSILVLNEIGKAKKFNRYWSKCCRKYSMIRRSNMESRVKLLLI